MYKIVRHEAFSDTTFLWEVEAPDVAAAAEPGHFVMLRLREGAERIPLTVADFDRKRGTITMVVQALGKTTREMMADYRAADHAELARRPTQAELDEAVRLARQAGITRLDPEGLGGG